ncbi:MAG: hypothetical protein EXR59_05480 [Dehalococcoidia bacterium]|nr:hypothetical protein [Dehalococcoidia bacterium]
MKVALQSISDAKSAQYEKPADLSSNHSIKVIWERARTKKKYEGKLSKDGRIFLSDGSGPFTPSGACMHLVSGAFNGWIEWKYFDDGNKNGCL